MWKVLFVLLVVALMPTVVQAGTLAGTLTDATDGYTITVNYTRTTGVLPGIDLVDFTIGSISDGGKGGRVNTVGGTKAQGNYAVFSVSGNNTPVLYTDDVDPCDVMVATPAPGSFVNLDVSVKQQFLGSRLATYNSKIHGYSGFLDTWFTETTTKDLIAGSDFADIYVSTGTNVTFTGALGTTTEVTNFYTGTCSTAPEPSTLVLLGIGSVTLLAYAWRRHTTAS